MGVSVAYGAAHDALGHRVVLPEGLTEEQKKDPLTTLVIKTDQLTLMGKVCTSIFPPKLGNIFFLGLLLIHYLLH